MVFDKAWFIWNQGVLLWLLNSKLTRLWFRWCLRIKEKRDIAGILPNAIFMNGAKDNEFVAEFRCHDKYSKRLFFAFKPLWYALHFWDLIVSPFPSLNLGFDSLTVYPSAGNVSGYDTYIRATGTNLAWATLRGATTGTAYPSATSLQASLTAGTTTGNYNLLDRAGALFDTTAIESDYTVTDATVSVKGSGKGNGLGSPDFGLRSFSPASNSSSSNDDFNNFGTSLIQSKYYSAFSTSAYMDFEGVTSMVVKAGISKFGFGLTWDIQNQTSGITWVSGGSSYFQFYAADRTGTSDDPKLVVVYTVPAPASTFRNKVRIF
jgi:hypothetical protein